MSHLMRHDGANLRERALLEQVVIQGDPRRPKETRYVRAYPVRLTGGVDLEDLRNRNLVRSGHGKNRLADFLVGKRLILIEERLDIDGSDHDKESEKENDYAGAP